MTITDKSIYGFSVDELIVKNLEQPLVVNRDPKLRSYVKKKPKLLVRWIGGDQKTMEIVKISKELFISSDREHLCIRRKNCVNLSHLRINIIGPRRQNFRGVERTSN